MAAACSAPAGTSPSEWLALGMSQTSTFPQRAAACFTDASLADPLAHAPMLHRGLLAMRDRHAPIEDATTMLSRAAKLALRETNTTGAAVAYRALGDAWTSVSSWESSASAYSRALAMEPDDCVTSAKLADAHAQLVARIVHVGAAVANRAAGVAFGEGIERGQLDGPGMANAGHVERRVAAAAAIAAQHRAELGARIRQEGAAR